MCFAVEQRRSKAGKERESRITLDGHGSLLPSSSTGTTIEIHRNRFYFGRLIQHHITLSQRVVSRRVICDFPSPPPPILLSFQCLCHSRRRPLTTLQTTSKPARGKDNARSPCNQILLPPNALPQRIPPKILKRISAINLRVLPLSHQSPLLSSRTLP